MTTALSESDGRYMRRALFLARQGRTHPNPRVGAVIVRNGRIVGEGFHKGVGTPHAEAAAFADAGEAARGATIYVTLEPCSFTTQPDGSPRTPCSHRCISAGISRVVAAMHDPDPRVSGTGFSQLRAAGIEVAIGVEEERARALNVGFIRQRLTGLPYITHKAALTLDGKIATSNGDSRWVTGPEARLFVHSLRDRADAVIVGIGTVLADDPSLTTRLPDGVGNAHDPIRVVIDSSLRIPLTSKVARSGTLVFTAEGRFTELRRIALEAAGVEIVVVAVNQDGRVDLEVVARNLASRGLLNLLLESGGKLAASFWQAELIDKALFFVAPKIIGGENAETPVEGAGPGFMRDARMLGEFTVRRFGPDIALEVEVIR